MGHGNNTNEVTKVEADDEFKPIREGFLLKRGVHSEDVYLKRWVTLWPSRIGYTMKVSSGKYCNFIPLEYITEVVPASDWTSDGQKACDFEVRVSARGIADLGDAGVPDKCTCLGGDNDDEDSRGRVKHHPRPYFLRASDVVERNQWMRDIRKAVRKAKVRLQDERHKSWIRKVQAKVRAVYTSSPVQGFASFLILSNFFVNAYEAQTNPQPGSNTESVLNQLDVFFTIVFTVELVWNMCSFWCLAFWKSSWNIFDFVIIVISIIGTSDLLPSGLSVLRAIRAVRVFRLFRRLDPLKQILISLGYAVKPVASAALFVLLFSSLYAVIGVSFFGDDFDEFFGDFLRSQLTLLQIMTFDGWIDSLTRGMLETYKQKVESGDISPDQVLSKQAGIVAFIVSYCLIGGLVLLNVVMAILVESFTEAKKQVALDNEQARARDLLTAPVSEPLEGLIREWGSIEDPVARDKAIISIFERMDVNKDKALTLPELQEGLWGLGSEPRNQLSDEDFERYTHERVLCNEHGSLDCEGFMKMVQALLDDYRNAVGAWRNKKVSLWDGTLWDVTGIREAVKRKKGFWYQAHKFVYGVDVEEEEEEEEDDLVVNVRRPRRSSAFSIISALSNGSKWHAPANGKASAAEEDSSTSNIDVLVQLRQQHEQQQLLHNQTRQTQLQHRRGQKQTLQDPPTEKDAGAFWT